METIWGSASTASENHFSVSGRGSKASSYRMSLINKTLRYLYLFSWGNLTPKGTSHCFPVSDLEVFACLGVLFTNYGSRGGQPIWVPHGRLPLEVFQDCPTGRRPRTSWKVIHLVWFENTSGSPRRSWKTLLGRGTFRLPRQRDPVPDER